MEQHERNLKVKFADIPPIRLLTMKRDDEPGRQPDDERDLWELLALATQRRRFALYENWELTLDKVAYDKRLNSTLVIPHRDDDDELIIFDGASIPFPWLISMLTIGILRPLGVMLVASIVHDYAYKFGCLKKSDGSSVPVERHVADRLFRDIIATVNDLPIVGWIGWFAVRLGWPVVKYAGKPQSGKPPIVEYLVLVAVVLGVIWLGTVTSFGLIALAFLSFYLGFAGIITLVRAVIKRTSQET
jgi:hypothetical protein